MRQRDRGEGRGVVSDREWDGLREWRDVGNKVKEGAKRRERRVKEVKNKEGEKDKNSNRE